MVEFALVAPLFTITLAGIIIFGLAIFYQQQLSNAAREAARYASIHSASSQCPTSSWIEPEPNRLPDDYLINNRCDPPDLKWPLMTAHARSKVFGLDRSDVHFAACWSGYWEVDQVTGVELWDAGPIDADGQPNEFRDCTIGGVDPRTSAAAIPCPPPVTVDGANPGEGDDQASNLAHSNLSTTNQVTIYACYQWSPPFLSSFTGGPITMRAVVTEAMQHQQ